VLGVNYRTVRARGHERGAAGSEQRRPARREDIHREHPQPMPQLHDKVTGTGVQRDEGATGGAVLTGGKVAFW
jgi:hypothetical protein